MKAFLSPMEELEELLQVKKRLGSGKLIQVTGCAPSGKAHMAYCLGNGFSHKIIASFSENKMREIYEDYRLFDRNALIYPAKDLIFFQSDIHGNLVTRQRMTVIKALIENPEVTVFTTADAFMDSLMPLDVIKASIITLRPADIIDVDGLVSDLVMLGYEKSYQAEQPGQFSVRGGIIDVYPLTEETPFRIELWDDEIDTIRSFDAATQRSIESLEEVRIYPATEIIADKARIKKAADKMRKESKERYDKLRSAMMTEEAHRVKTVTGEIIEELTETGTSGRADSFIRYFYDETVTLQDYFPEGTLLILDEPARIMEKLRVTEKEFTESMLGRFEKGYILSGQMGILRSAEDVASHMEKMGGVALTLMDAVSKDFKISGLSNIPCNSVNPYNNSIELLTKDLKRYKKNGSRVILLCPSVTRAKRLAEDLRDFDLNSFYTEDPDREVQPREILVTYGNIKQGFEYPLINFAVISETDIFGAGRQKKKKHTVSGNAISSFAEISPGDYVVHENHGLGIYRGIEKIEVEGISKDYIKIEYDKGDNLYILATQLETLQKYAGADARKPKLNKLGGVEWNKTKSKVKTAVWQVANDLVELYALRQSKEGYKYGRDTVWQKEFEETFPYEETEDQLLAIEAAKRDMESTKIMDRLVCGYVGYGKTEIALRVAFKAVQEGKQVVYLVPTTILAQQHYNTFIQRMKDYPVKVDLLCRFRTPAEQKKTIEGLKKGSVDIVIATHRVLSADVSYKDLGVLIIDEEQRFGVSHKEKIKKLRNNVDVLTLTATPIPRTLHMSLIGIRDMSVLEEPPMDRMPVQTFVMEYDEEMVREAINRELARNGQIYYVYNRVNDIADIRDRIAAMVPEARVEYAHGQMRENRLEDIMYDFINGEIDVLVSTTIIETGMDITNVNTIIIHDSDNMGLAQLYQLRGRVGRSNRNAYAYLMYRRNKLLKETAEKRLHAIKEFTELGSGIRIAMRDLDIRGAGNLLGMEQSGNMSAVGYDMYCKLLNEAIAHLKGEKQEDEFETSVYLDVDAFIPDRYIASEYQKFDIYKRIAEISSREEYDEMYSELLDRFGNLPKLVENLMDIAYLKALAHKVYVTDISQKGSYIKLTMYEKAKVDPEKIPELVQMYKGRLGFRAEANPFFTY
ncbi:MAG: transcription-repair coupling factor, partial [Lachnospiraceae bacterium]|nr:transcription-repair coupling factor [Lachnospiraceae bacterium]